MRERDLISDSSFSRCRASSRISSWSFYTALFTLLGAESNDGWVITHFLHDPKPRESA